MPLLLLLLSGCRPLLGWLCDQPEAIRTLPLPSGEALHITADPCWEYSRPLFYEILSDTGQVVVRRTFFGADAGTTDHPYRIVQADAGALLGLAEADALLILYDVSAQAAWPSADSGDTTDWTARQQRLLSAHPSLSLSPP